MAATEAAAEADDSLFPDAVMLVHNGIIYTNSRAMARSLASVAAESADADDDG